MANLTLRRNQVNIKELHGHDMTVSSVVFRKAFTINAPL